MKEDKLTVRDYAVTFVVGCLFYAVMWICLLIFDGGYYAG